MRAVGARTVHVGVDAHKRSYSVALLRSDGAWKEWTAPSSPKALESTLLPLRSRIGAVGYAAGPTGENGCQPSVTYRPRHPQGTNKKEQLFARGLQSIRTPEEFPL